MTTEKALAIVPRSLDEVMTVGKVLAASGFFRDSASQAQAVAKIIAGQELGFGPMASMTGIYIVNGRVTLSANLMAAAIKRSGKYDYRVEKLNDEECCIKFFQRVDGKWEEIGTSAITMKDAVAKGWHQEWDKDKREWREKATWKKYPANMLFARCISNGQKWYCPDIAGGPLYTPDEFDLPTNEDGEVVIEGAAIESVVVHDDTGVVVGEVIEEAEHATVKKEPADKKQKAGDKKEKEGKKADPGLWNFALTLHDGYPEYFGELDLNDPSKGRQLYVEVEGLIGDTEIGVWDQEREEELMEQVMRIIKNEVEAGKVASYRSA